MEVFFQPTHPSGVRRPLAWLLWFGRVLSTHTPQRGATQSAAVDFNSMQLSTHTPQRGATVGGEAFCFCGLRLSFSRTAKRRAPRARCFACFSLWLLHVRIPIFCCGMALRQWVAYHPGFRRFVGILYPICTSGEAFVFSLRRNPAGLGECLLATLPTRCRT